MTLRELVSMFDAESNGYFSIYVAEHNDWYVDYDFETGHVTRLVPGGDVIADELLDCAVCNMSMVLDEEGESVMHVTVVL